MSSVTQRFLVDPTRRLHSLLLLPSGSKAALKQSDNVTTNLHKPATGNIYARIHVEAKSSLP